MEKGSNVRLGELLDRLERLIERYEERANVGTWPVEASKEAEELAEKYVSRRKWELYGLEEEP